jgi:hypothetical protein
MITGAENFRPFFVRSMRPAGNASPEFCRISIFSLFQATDELLSLQSLKGGADSGECKVRQLSGTFSQCFGY